MESWVLVRTRTTVSVVIYSLKVALDGVLALGILLVSICAVSEGLLLGVLPVLVEAALELIRKMLSVDG